MASTASIAKRYATSLFDLGGAAKGADKVVAELLSLRDVVRGNEDLAHLFASPVIGRRQQWNALQAVLQKLKVSDLIEKFMGVLTHNRRLSLFEDVVEAFLTLQAESEGRQRIEVTTARPLTKKQQDTLLAKLEDKLKTKVELDIKEDATLLGGLKIRLGSVLVDSSLSSKLNRLTHSLKGE